MGFKTYFKNPLKPLKKIMNAKFQAFSLQISKFYEDDAINEIGLLGAASDLKTEIDRMVEELIKKKQLNKSLKKMTMLSLAQANVAIQRAHDQV